VGLIFTYAVMAICVAIIERILVEDAPDETTTSTEG
jgi:hypothetical protein